MPKPDVTLKLSKKIAQGSVKITDVVIVDCCTHLYDLIWQFIGTKGSVQIPSQLFIFCCKSAGSFLCVCNATEL